MLHDELILNEQNLKKALSIIGYSIEDDEIINNEGISTGLKIIGHCLRYNIKNSGNSWFTVSFFENKISIITSDIIFIGNENFYFSLQRILKYGK